MENGKGEIIQAPLVPLLRCRLLLDFRVFNISINHRNFVFVLRNMISYDSNTTSKLSDAIPHNLYFIFFLIVNLRKNVLLKKQNMMVCMLMRT